MKKKNGSGKCRDLLGLGPIVWLVPYLLLWVSGKFAWFYFWFSFQKCLVLIRVGHLFLYLTFLCLIFNMGLCLISHFLLLKLKTTVISCVSFLWECVSHNISVFWECHHRFHDLDLFPPNLLFSYLKGPLPTRRVVRSSCRSSST